MSFHSPTLHPSKSAFTLIESLVVIAIIGLLAAILFPVFAKAREDGRRASCRSNLRQIGLAIEMYTQDYDETYPTFYGPAFGSVDDITFNMWKALQPYSKNTQIFYCPSTSDYTECLAVTGCTESGKEISYGFNVGPVWKQEEGDIMGGIYGQASFYPRNEGVYTTMLGIRRAKIVSASTMFVASDGFDTWVHSMDSTASFQYPLPTTNSTWRHSNWRNVLFADGHVKSIQWRAGKNPASLYYWGEAIMVPRDPKYYDSYCANPEEPISFPLQPGLTRCGDIAGSLATFVRDWQPD